MLTLVSALLVATQAQPVTGRPPSPREILVVGKRLADTEGALAACLARGCSAAEDINASLAHAENLLLSGNYRGARSVLKASIGRNKDEVRRNPEPLSDLYRANAMVASHLGFDNDYWSSTHEIYRTLKAGIPAQDHRHLQAKMEIAAMTAKVKGLDRGERAYDRAADDARRIGREDIAGMAEVRGAMLSYKQSRGSSKAALRRLMETARDPFVAKFAKLFYASALRWEGKTAEADRLVKEALPDNPRPILLYSPPYALVEQELPGTYTAPSGAADLASGNVLRRPSRNFERKWVDVAFFVQPNGSVTDVEVVRSENDILWSKPVLKSIAGRRYTPFTGQLPYPKLERYTYTAGYEAITGSHIAARSPKARVEYLDLTVREPLAKE